RGARRRRAGGGRSLDRSRETSASLPDRRGAPAGRAPRDRERADRRLDRRGGDDRASAGAGVSRKGGDRRAWAPRGRAGANRRNAGRGGENEDRAGALCRRRAGLGRARKRKPVRALAGGGSGAVAPAVTGGLAG